MTLEARHLPQVWVAYCATHRSLAPSLVGPLMSDVTRILSQIEQGDPQAAEKLLPLVYDELRKLAAVKLAQEKPGQTLQATALVHEAYVHRLAPQSSRFVPEKCTFSEARFPCRELVPFLGIEFDWPTAGQIA